MILRCVHMEEIEYSVSHETQLVDWSNKVLEVHAH